MSNPLRPPFPYYGGKQTLADRIVSLFPDHAHYVEPYAGSLAVLLAKRPSLIETVNDLDGELVTFWRVLRDRPDDLFAACALSPHARSEYEAIRDAQVPPGDDLEVARRIWVQLTQGRAGTRRPAERTGWRHVIGPNAGVSILGYLDGYLKRFPPAVSRLRQVSLECRPALDVVAAYGAEPTALLYVDPPYVADSRTSKGYRHEMTDADHRALAEALRSARAGVVLSGYPCDLYDRELYLDWERVELAAQTTQGGKGERRTEVLWSNRPLTRQGDLFDLAGCATRA